jgi:hypothetical protein
MELRETVRSAIEHLAPERLLGCAAAALADDALDSSARRTWTAIAFALDPQTHRASFVDAHHAQTFLTRRPDDMLTWALDTLMPIDPRGRVERDVTLVRLVGSLPPEYVDESTELLDLIDDALLSLINNPSLAARDALRALADDSALEPWRFRLRHESAMWAREYRERTFQYPTAAALCAALANGPPISARDLLAVVMEEMYRLQRELRTSDSSPWKRYWNIDSQERVTVPLVENQCRNHFLDRLRDRLARYGIAAAFPEGPRSGGARTDVLIVSVAGCSIPIEIKRHFNPDLWEAPSTQLQRYADSMGSDGFGIYLVLWFGCDVAPTRRRADGQPGPTTAEELENMLRDDLASSLRERSRIVVYDVSRR